MKIIGHLGHEEVIYLNGDKCITHHKDVLKVYTLHNADANRTMLFDVDDWYSTLSLHIPDDMWVHAPDIFLPKLADLV